MAPRRAELDARVPSEDRAGVDIAPSDGLGTASIVHDAIRFVILGTFEGPRVVEGAGSDIASSAGAPGPSPSASRSS